MAWASRAPIKGVLLDITGVLYDSTPSGGVAIKGSVDAVNRSAFTSILVTLVLELKRFRLMLIGLWREPFVKNGWVSLIITKPNQS